VVKSVLKVTTAPRPLSLEFRAQLGPIMQISAPNLLHSAFSAQKTLLMTKLDRRVVVHVAPMPLQRKVQPRVNA